MLGRAGRVAAREGELPAGAPGPRELPVCSAGEAHSNVLAERIAVRGAPGVRAAVVADVVTADDLAPIARSQGLADATVALVSGEHVLAAAGKRTKALARVVPASPGTVERDGEVAVVAPVGRELPWHVAVVGEDSGGIGGAAVAAIAVPAALLMLGLGLLVARDLTGPLAELTDAAERVASGDLGRDLPVQAEDEVGRLTSSFNRVTSDLRRSLAELERSRDEMRESLQRMGDALQKTHDIEGLLRVVLETAVAISDASGGLAGRVEGSSFTLFAEQGLRNAGHDVSERSRTGAGVIGRVAATGADLRGVLGEGELAPAPGEPQRGHVVALPLRHGAAVNAVLAVYRDAGADPFAEEQVDALRTLAGQASIAVENVRLHSEAQRLSMTDPMTGLRNFRYLSLELAREIERATRFDRPLSVLMLDLDHFKSINDTYGHARGDAVLRELAVRLSEVKREVDTLARYGGEEFVLVLPETGADGATMFADRVCAAVRREPFDGEGAEPLRVTASVGVASFPEHGASAAMLMRRADEALYVAKRAGRDQWRLAEGERHEAVADG